MAVLAHADTVTFAFLKNHLEIKDADLSKQMATLERAGYLQVIKHGHGRGGTTAYRLTRSGRAAYERHRAAIRALLDGDPAEDPAQA